MHLGKQITLALVAWPLAELLVFVLVAAVIGVSGALALMVLTTIVGALVLRQAGRAGIAQVRRDVAGLAVAGEVPPGRGMVLALAGILLILPGFITDVAGALLLVAPLRRMLGATIGRASSGHRDPAGRDAVVDLAPTEWRQVGEAKLPPREDRDERH